SAPPTPATSPLSLHDALPIFDAVSGRTPRPMTASLRDRRRAVETALWIDANSHRPIDLEDAAAQAGISPFHFLRLFSDVLGVTRSEEHTSELQSRSDLVCRLL